MMNPDMETTTTPNGNNGLSDEAYAALTTTRPSSVPPPATAIRGKRKAGRRAGTRTTVVADQAHSTPASGFYDATAATAADRFARDPQWRQAFEVALAEIRDRLVADKEDTIKEIEESIAAIDRRGTGTRTARKATLPTARATSRTSRTAHAAPVQTKQVRKTATKKVDGRTKEGRAARMATQATAPKLAKRGVKKARVAKAAKAPKAKGAAVAHAQHELGPQGYAIVKAAGKEGVATMLLGKQLGQSAGPIMASYVDSGHVKTSGRLRGTVYFAT